MNKKQLQDRVNVQWIGYGSYEVKIVYRGRSYYCTSNDSLTYDRLKRTDIADDWKGYYGFTKKQALQSLYDECKRANDL